MTRRSERIADIGSSRPIVVATKSTATRGRKRPTTMDQQMDTGEEDDLNATIAVQPTNATRPTTSMQSTTVEAAVGHPSLQDVTVQLAQQMATMTEMMRQMQQQMMEDRIARQLDRNADPAIQQRALELPRTPCMPQLPAAPIQLQMPVAFSLPQHPAVNAQHTNNAPMPTNAVNRPPSLGLAAYVASSSSLSTQSDSRTSGASVSGSEGGSVGPQQQREVLPNGFGVANTMAQKPYELPDFSGLPEQWPAFVAAYRQSTAAFAYTPLQNMFRLQKSLKGAARDAVQCLLINPDNVDELMSSLEFRFGRAEILAQSQRLKLRDVDDIPEKRIDLLVPYSSHVQNMVAFLDNEESRHVLTETTLLAELVSKLPPTKQLDWVQHSVQFKPRPTVNNFSSWLKGIAICVSMLTANQAPSAQSASHTSAGGPSTTGQASRRHSKHVLLNAPKSETSLSEQRTCSVCTRAHKVSECDKFRAMQLSERWAIARRSRLCYGCMRTGHMFEACRSKKACAVDGCTFSHHELLHGADASQPTRSDQARGVQQRSEPMTEAVGPWLSADEVEASASTGRRENPFNRRPDRPPPTVLTCHESPEELPLLFRTLPVTLHGPDAHADTYALFDEGSSVTMLDAGLADALNLEGPVSNLDVHWFGQQTSSVRSRCVNLHISGPSHTRYQISNVRTVHDLRLPVQSVTVSQLDDRHRHLRDLPIAEYHNVAPQILIGLEHSHLGVSSDTRTNASGGPIAARTRLGWVIYGRQPSPERVMLCAEASGADDRLERLVKDYFTTENFGVNASCQPLESNADARARQILRSTTVRVGARFQTGLLWRSDGVLLPDSYAMACKRFATLEHKMRRDPAYKELYTKQIADLLAKRYARVLTPEEASVRTARTWYLPHFGHQSVHKPNKLRLVFDAAAKAGGTCLNAALLKGPDMNQSLTAILFEFRMRKVGVCADIAEMFLQIEVQPCDRDSQRFLWRCKPGDGPPDVLEMRVMTFGATCSPTSAQYVKNYNASLYEREYPAAARAIRELHYVDDFVASFESEEEAVVVTRDVVEIHKRGGFNLRGFVSNSATVLRALGAAEPASDTVDMQMDAGASDKILGMRWSTRDDNFFFAMRFERVDPAVVAGMRRPTKREVLSAAMSVFDPFGFLANFMLECKLIVQSLWKTGTEWDEPIPAEAYNRWIAWCSEIHRTKDVRVPRCYSPNLIKSTSVQLHVFADASEQAFAAVAFWRIACADRCEVSFVCAKTKCAPPKLLSIPRLELQAAVLAVRLQQTIRDAHAVKIEKLVMWTDSQTVMQWIQSNERRYQPFVAHRVAEIIDGTGVACWRWVPTKDNVADDATRRRDPPRFNPESRWLRGPAFLAQNETCWPTAPATSVIRPNNVLPEEICRGRYVGAVSAGELFPFHRFSKFLRLVRTAAWMRRFAHNARCSAHVDGRHRRGELDAVETGGTIDTLCRIAQKEGFPAEFAALQDGNEISRSSRIRALLPYMDNGGILRIYGRTDAADEQYLSAEAQRPILLPHHHRFTELLVQQQHIDCAHQFEDGTICAVRKRYWVPNLRQLVRTVKHRCQACKIRAAQPRPPVAGQLPMDRLTPHVHAFCYTGLDYFGPVHVTVGRRKEKRWIALFTCLTTRAIHMEVAADLTTDSCLLCIKNFCNQRGVPRRIRSDCGTNFVGADREMRRLEDFIDTSEVQRELSAKGIEWLFNCPANPEAGGAWERLVQSTKRVLNVTLKQIAPQVETLRALIIEAANLINARPLTHVPVSSSDPEPLTPNHFILGRANTTTVAGPIEPRQLSSRKQWRVQQQMVRQFWSRWVNEYLPELTRRSRFYEDVGSMNVGDLVMVCDANQSRSQWMRGRIEKVNVGTDGRVRTAEVRTSGGLMRRPVSKLARLDVDVDEAPGGVLMGPGMSPIGRASDI